MSKAQVLARNAATIVSLTAALVTCVTAENTLHPRRVRRAAVEVIGISARTSFAKESSAEGLMPQLWKRFYKDSVIDNIPAKTDDTIVSVYTLFSGDATTGEYTAVLGAPVKAGTKPPDGMEAVQVPAGKYLEFTTEQGPLAETVPKLWRHITEYFQKPDAPKRSFKADYEVYEAGMNPLAATGKIYVGVQ
jgi:predicted transcriptional regulator YdeE